MVVSVVIPSYNHNSYVLQAIDSVLQQSWPKIELIVIDDGSTDGSPELIQKFWEEKKGFRYIRRENRGLLHTLNQGLEMARGEFFCELASDDYFFSDSIELRAGFLLDNPDKVAVFADGVSVVNEKLTNKRILTEKHRRIFAKGGSIRDMISGVRPVFSTGLVRTDALREIGGFDAKTFRYYEDLDTPLRLCVLGQFGFLDKPVICRREHGSNISRSTQHIRAEKILCLEKLLKDPDFSPYRKLIRNRLRRSYLALGRYLTCSRGGTAMERKVFRGGWQFVWRDFRLLYYLLKWGQGGQ